MKKIILSEIPDNMVSHVVELSKLQTDFVSIVNQEGIEYYLLGGKASKRYLEDDYLVITDLLSEDIELLRYDPSEGNINDVLNKVVGWEGVARISAHEWHLLYNKNKSL